MKQVKCKSGLTGWQERLRKVYNTFEEFEGYCENYSISERLGYNSPQEAWDANPTIQGSVRPEDCRVVLSEDNEVEFIRPEVEAIFKKFYDGKATKEQLIKKLHGFDGRLKRQFSSKNNQAIWFRLFKGDTGATTIESLESLLNSKQGEANRKYTMECIECGLELGMVVYYS